MTNNELIEKVIDAVGDEEVAKEIIVLEGDEFADGCIGITSEFHLVYDWDKLVESLMQHCGLSYQDAVDHLDYNTLGSLESMKKEGREPIILMHRIEDM